MELDRGEDALEGEEEEDWNDTRWAVPQNDTLSIKMPSDVGKSQTSELSEVTGVKNETGKKEDKKQDVLMSRMEINDHKAGMEGLDREKINQIIFETSKGSKFFENERKKEEQVNKRVEEQKRKLDKLTDLQIQQGLVGIDKLLIELEEGRDLNHSIVHVDMDAFYAAVEERDDPSLKDKPMAVGGLYMLSTSNYNARKYGVRAGMPGFIGKKLCPDLVMVGTNFEKYTSVSHEIREVMAQYDPNFCPMSLDEAYLDFTKHMSDRKDSSALERTFYYRPDDSVCCCIAENLDFDFEEQYEMTREDAHRLLNTNEDHDMSEVSSEKCPAPEKESSGAKSESVTDTEEKTCSICGKVLPRVNSLRTGEFTTSLVDAVNEMRFRIHQKTKLTASAGIAANSMLAKVCSDMNKPNGQFMVESTVEVVKEFIRDLPIRKISGIGKVSEKMLSAIGIKTCSDLLAKRGILYHLYSATSFNYFMRIALGSGSTKIVGEENYKRKSYSNERTFGEISKPAELFKKCLVLCESLCEGLKEENIKGRTVTLKIKTVTFLVKTKAQSLMTLTNDLEPIYSAARDLLRTEIQSMAPQPLKLRLMGVRLSNLVNLNESDHPKQRTITDIIKKMQSSPKKTQTNATSAQVSNCDVLDSDHVLPTLDFLCDSASASETPVSTTDSIVAQHSSSVLQLKAYDLSESDLASNAVPATSKELKESCTNVSDIQKKSIGSTSVKSTKKSVLDMLKAKATANISTHSVISEGGSCAKSAEMKESHLSSVDALQTLQNSLHKRQEPDTIEVLPGTSKDCSDPITQTVLAGTSSNKNPALSNIQPGVTHTPDEDNNDMSIKMSSEDHKEDHYECPICCKLLEGYSSHKISVHVDQCLSLSEDNNNGGDNDNLHSINTQNTQPKTDIVSSTSGDCVTPKRHTNTSATTTALGTQPTTSTMTNAMVLSTPKRSTKSGITMRNSSSKASSSSAAKKQTKTPQRPSNPQRAQNDDDSALICPVCDLEQDTYDLVAFNKHMDSCLSKATIRQIVRQQDTETPNKRLNSGQDKGGPPKKKIKVGTIESFFRK